MAVPVCKRVTGLLTGAVGVSTASDCGESSRVRICERFLLKSPEGIIGTRSGS